MKVFNFFIRALTNILFIGVMGVVIAFGLCWINKIEFKIVGSGSMEPAIETGSLLFVNQKVPYEEIKENDIILFQIGNGHVTHRVVSVTEEGLETKGDANTYSDGISTTEENYCGKVLSSSPELGYLYRQLKTTKGIILWVTFSITLYLANRICDEWRKEEAEKKAALSIGSNETDAERKELEKV